jgi:hypothetical protein
MAARAAEMVGMAVPGVATSPKAMAGRASKGSLPTPGKDLFCLRLKCCVTIDVPVQMEGGWRL